MSSFLVSALIWIIIQPMLKYFCNPSQSIDLDHLVIYLKALADPNRLRIFNLLMEGSQCNCELGENLGLPPNLISHHLALLRQIGLVTAERHPTDARWIIYSVNREVLSELNAALQTLLEPGRIQLRQPQCRQRDASPDSTRHSASRR